MAADVIPLRVEVVSLQVPPFITDRVNQIRQPFKVEVAFDQIDVKARFEQAMSTVSQPFPVIDDEVSANCQPAGR